MCRNPYKISVLIFAFSCTIGSLGTVFLGRMYPILPVSVAFGAFSIYLIMEVANEFRWPYLLCFVGFSIFYRCFTFLYPKSLTGSDADTYAFAIARVLDSHSTSAIPFGFYENAPLYIILGADVSQLTGLPIRYGLSYIPLIIGIIIPATAYIGGRQFSPRIGHLASLLTILAPSAALLSFNPVAQSLSAAMLMVLFILFSIYIDQESWSPLLPLLILFLAIYYTHKLAPQMLAVAFVGGLFISVIKTPRIYHRENMNRGKHYITFALIVIVGTYLHWVVTGVDSSIIAQLLVALTGGPANATPKVSITAAEPTISNPLFAIIGNIGYRIPLLLLSGLGWGLVWYKHGNRPWVQVLLALVSSYMVLAIVAQFGLARHSSTRYLLPIVPFLAILSAYVINLQQSKSVITYPRMKIVLTLLLVIAIIGPQSVSLLGPRDSAVSERVYLTENELDGKLWGHEYIQGPVYTDQFYASELPPSKLEDFAKNYVSPPGKHQDRSVDILNKNLGNMSCTGMVRTNVKRYNYHGKMKLSYDPENEVELFNTLYSNGNVVAFNARGSCQSQ